MKKLVLATHNRDKAREISALLSDLGVDVLTLDAFPQIGPIVEDAGTLEGNALLKANAVSRATGLPSLGDDTGLEVHSLYGEPGVYSSRYSGEMATYSENVAKLIDRLKHFPPRRRGARASWSSVRDVADHSHREGRIDCQRFFGVDADLALSCDNRPVDLVVVLPDLQLGHVGDLV